MRSMAGKALLSINDHPQIREVFAGMPMETVPIQYTVGGAGKPVNRRELIIRSWL